MIQEKLEGVMREVAEIEDAAKQYVEVRDRRMELTKDEVEAHGILLEAMKRAGAEFYRTTNGMDCRIEEKEKVKVSRAKAEKDEG